MLSYRNVPRKRKPATRCTLIADMVVKHDHDVFDRVPASFFFLATLTAHWRNGELPIRGEGKGPKSEVSGIQA